ncbi:MAG: response regulator, partial [Ignavibacteriaceae bacterium]|nr:response regulator [Ignavibacteriaceae bacterium]
MEKIKILLVDDEKEFVETLSERIRMREHDSDVALNGEQALKKMDDDLPDVVVLDLKMPTTPMMIATTTAPITIMAPPPPPLSGAIGVPDSWLSAIICL